MSWVRNPLAAPNISDPVTLRFNLAPRLPTFAIRIVCAALRWDFTKQNSHISLREKSGKIIEEKGGTGVEADCVRGAIPQTNSQRLSCSMLTYSPN